VVVGDLLVVDPKNTGHSIVEGFEVVYVTPATIGIVDRRCHIERTGEWFPPVLAPSFPSHRLFVGLAFRGEKAMLASVRVELVC